MARSITWGLRSLCVHREIGLTRKAWDHWLGAASNRYHSSPWTRQPLKASSHYPQILRSITPERTHSNRLSSSGDGQHMVTISNSRGGTSDVNAIWLRENCQCDACYTHSTNQRHVLFNTFGADIKPSSQEARGDHVHITWTDGHESVYNISWLEKHLYSDTSAKFLWNAASLSAKPMQTVSYNDVIAEDSALATLLSNVNTYGFGLVDHVPADEASTQRVVERVSFIQETFFGRMWTFTADLSRGDTAYTNIALGAHTDATYLETPCGIQVFHCIYHDGEGGETLLVDGFHSCEQVRREDPFSFQLLSDTRIEHEYREPGVHVRSLDSVINVHPVSGELRRLRYNQYDRSPISTIYQRQVGHYYEALRLLSRHVENPDNEYWLKLKPGTVLFIDNWRVMHGRAAFSGKRTLTGCYLPRDNWLSKARCLNVI